METDSRAQLEISRTGGHEPNSRTAHRLRIRRALEARGVAPATRSIVRTDRVAVPCRGAISARFRKLFV